jgi:hypothetical protein
MLNKARVSLCQYIARNPVSLPKITYEPDKKKVIYHTRYNEYWGENLKLFTALDFIAELTQHIPPEGKHLIRYYGLYASRTKGWSFRFATLLAQASRENQRKMGNMRSLV